jgi:hypothetical protein
MLFAKFSPENLMLGITEEESESEGEIEDGQKLTKSRDDIKRSSLKLLRHGKSKDGIPDEVIIP